MRRISDPRPPAGVRRALFRLPIHLYRLRLGWLLGLRFVLIHHTGRRSGRRHRVVVEVVARDPAAGTVTVASGFGPRADWYRNLLPHPDTEIELGVHRYPVRAVPLTPEQGGEVMVGYARRHGRAARFLARFLGFAVDGSADDYRAAGREIPFIRFDPRDQRTSGR